MGMFVVRYSVFISKTICQDLRHAILDVPGVMDRPPVDFGPATLLSKRAFRIYSIW